jgi:hypothetical protein
MTKKWITIGLKISCKKKHKLFIKYLKNPTEENREKWKTYSRTLKKTCRKAEYNYFRQLIEDTEGSLRKLWHVFKPILNINCQKQHKKIEKINIDGKIINDSKQIADSFNDYFCGIGKALSQKLPKMSMSYTNFLKQSNPNSMFVNPITQHEIIQEISKLKDKKAIGVHDIPVRILKSSKEILARPLERICNMSIQQGVFPNLMKIARVTPIHKNNEREYLQNYRPISILCCVSKIIEKLMYKRLNNFLEKYSILYDKQFGFHHKHSTIHALTEVTEKIKFALDNDELVMGIYLDVKKAFDTVNHGILLSKLNRYMV